MTDECASLQSEYDALLLKPIKEEQDERRILEIEAALARLFGPTVEDDDTLRNAADDLRGVAR